jgi:hypothetical protein
MRRTLAVSLCLWLCSSGALPWAAPPPRALADDGKAALQLIPADAAFIASLNVEQLRGSPLYRALWAQLIADPAMADALRQLNDGAGFNAERDLSTLLLLSPADIGTSQDYLLVAQGRFDRARFLALAQSKGAAYQERAHQGVTFYEVGPLAAIGFIDSFLVVGTPASLRAAVDALRGTSPRLLTGAAAAHFARIDHTQDAWFLLSLPPPMRADLAAAAGLPAAGEVVAVTGSLDLQKGLEARVTLHASTPTAAQALTTFCGALFPALASQPILQDAGLSAALTLAKVTASGKDISLTLSLNPAELTRALDALTSPEAPDE